MLEKRQVLLFSGGMDSMIAAHLHPTALKLYVATGSKYQEKELAYLKSAYTENEIKFDFRLNLHDIEREDAIVPARNLFLTVIASLYGDSVILCAVNGDGSTDKDALFASMQTELLQHIFSPPHFTDYKPTVYLPMREKSKGEWVRWYLENSGSAEKLMSSVSCYHPHHFYCGRCKACIRKWVAQEINGLVGTPWDQHPSGYEWDQFIPKILAREWRCVQEDADTEAVLRRFGVI